eukprot:COSAG01_NODE_31345_length_599_cov_1.002000_1_plen_186_part_10
MGCRLQPNLGNVRNAGGEGLTDAEHWPVPDLPAQNCPSGHAHVRQPARLHCLQVTVAEAGGAAGGCGGAGAAAFTVAIIAAAAADTPIFTTSSSGSRAAEEVVSLAQPASSNDDRNTSRGRSGLVGNILEVGAAAPPQPASHACTRSPSVHVKRAGVDDQVDLWDCLSFNSQPPPRGTPIGMARRM